MSRQNSQESDNELNQKAIIPKDEHSDQLQEFELEKNKDQSKPQRKPKRNAVEKLIDDSLNVFQKLLNKEAQELKNGTFNTLINGLNKEINKKKEIELMIRVNMEMLKLNEEIEHMEEADKRKKMEQLKIEFEGIKTLLDEKKIIKRKNPFTSGDEETPAKKIKIFNNSNEIIENPVYTEIRKNSINEKNSDHEPKYETINNDLKDNEEVPAINIKEFKIENEDEKNILEINGKISELENNGSGKKDKVVPPKNGKTIRDYFTKTVNIKKENMHSPKSTKSENDLNLIKKNDANQKKNSLEKIKEDPVEGLKHNLLDYNSILKNTDNLKIKEFLEISTKDTKNMATKTLEYYKHVSKFIKKEILKENPRLINYSGRLLHIHNSFFPNRPFDHRKSEKISAKNPFKKDDMLVDYERDSEEEFEEMNGEDVKSNEGEEDEEKEEKDEEEIDDAEQWIVPDGYLSKSELDSCEEEGSETKNIVKTKSIIELMEIRKNYSKPIIINLKMIYTDIKQAEVLNLVKAKTFDKKNFPIKILSKPKVLKESQIKADPNLNEKIKEKLEEMLVVIHGTYEKKEAIIKKINKDFPEISKAQVEKFLKINANKVKNEENGKKRWMLNEKFIDSNKIEKELLNKIQINNENLEKSKFPTKEKSEDNENHIKKKEKKHHSEKKQRVINSQESNNKTKLTSDSKVNKSKKKKSGIKETDPRQMRLK